MAIEISKGKALSVFSLTMINVIAIDSIRNLPINAKYGLSIGFFYLMGTLLFLIPTALVTAELATHRPQTGGTYIWVRDAFGPRWGFVNIWLQWIYNVVWYPTILSFIAASIAYLINPALTTNKIYMISMIIGTFMIATLVNSFGIKTSAKISTLGALLGTLLPMTLMILLSICWILQGKPLAAPFDTVHLFPHLSEVHNVAFFVVILFSLMGLEMSAVHAGDVKNPKRDYPRALLYSSLLIVISLIFSSIAIAIVLPTNTINIISGVNAAFATFLQTNHLSWLLPIAVLMIILGGFCGMAAWVIGPTRGLMVAAQDGCLPPSLARINQKGAPIAILILQWIVVCLLCLLFLFFNTVNAAYWILSDLTAQLALVYYITFFAAALRLRYKTPLIKNAYRIPGGKIGIWIVCGVGILTCVSAIIAGFLIPTDIVDLSQYTLYEWVLSLGMVVFIVLPLIIYALSDRESVFSGEK